MAVQNFIEVNFIFLGESEAEGVDNWNIIDDETELREFLLSRAFDARVQRARTRSRKQVRESAGEGVRSRWAIHSTSGNGDRPWRTHTGSIRVPGEKSSQEIGPNKS